MRNASQNSGAARRAPRRRRGHERVAALLEAAAACFVEKGYDGATMTGIAARAGAAIGSLYQFFPTKEALALALAAAYADALERQLQRLAARSAGWTPEHLAAQLVRLLGAFRRRHPAFAALAEAAATQPALRTLAVRRRLREGLRELLRGHAPGLAEAELQAAAVVVLQLMKAAVALGGEPGLSGRRAALAGLERALALYLADLSRPA
ncbi:TetR family transcriptional regulator [Fulvimonas soli]|jgi:AcrR family transcriptional regulator|uniref:TetR family transcriptional regulator n=1 Tax=Fulvimonas soli TaxID=155197 RepID=A0A316HTF7_9GAMM|nr:TetR family transcriptional regulator [Fulvimonas soli]PWK81538.1 TetR family transcriptional regulator [Fulvimonas soli]TNY26736.1 hypothetical protein BV497_07170 [Fulvimonas soli]